MSSAQPLPGVGTSSVMYIESTMKTKADYRLNLMRNTFWFSTIFFLNTTQQQKDIDEVMVALSH